MNLDEKIINRFDALINQGLDVKKTYVSGVGRGYYGPSTVSTEKAGQWGISCLNLLGRVFGKESDHYRRFDELYEKIYLAGSTQKAFGILLGAKEDYENGYLFETRVLIQAEVFGDFLEQASHLLDHGYYGPAAVVAGSVLEDGLRKLCARNNITLTARPKLDTMNADLAKGGAYNLLTQQKVTALAALRNKAAHGEWTAFSAADVKLMIEQVHGFMEVHFS
ncbi:MAG TPA: DUF4145 domain-containing protein [Chloroflexia bacterium]|jgi:hypothetical protein